MSQALRGWRLSAAIFTLHAVVFVALTAWSWRKWLDPVIDAGRELYVPWAITRGHVLYRDIASLFGPLSPYVNALWFRLFGDSLLTLAVCNLAIFAALVFGIYVIVRTATDRFTATTASLVTLLLFGFSQYVRVGNYNFVMPYSHEATHGLALCIALIVCLYRHLASSRQLFAILAGLCFGLVVLTKPDTSLAAVAALGAGGIGAWWLDSDSRRQLVRGLPLFVVAAGIPPLCFLIYFASAMPLDLAIRGVAGAWSTTFMSGIATNEFYLRVSGLDEPWRHLGRMLWSFALLAIYFGIVAAACWTRGDQHARPRLVKRVQQIALLAIGVLYVMRGMPFFALPAVSALGLVVFAVKAARARRADRPAALLLVMWSALSLVLLAKIVLAVRIAHYGFYLSLPAMVTAIVLICSTIPDALDRYTPTAARQTFRAIVLCLLLATITPYLLVSKTWFAARVIPFGFGHDRFWASNAPAYPPATLVQEALEDLQRRVGPDSPIAVLPQGAMLNYQLRRETPLRIINLMPPEIIAFGEQEVVRSLEAAPPDLIVVIHCDVTEYNYPVFGTDPRYGQQTLAWVNRHYRVARVIGRDRDNASIPAVQIWERANSLAR